MRLARLGLGLRELLAELRDFLGSSTASASAAPSVFFLPVESGWLRLELSR